MECSISLKGPKRDWQSLERKISKGMSVDAAARAAGIPVEEIYTYISEKLGTVDTLNWQLRLIGQAGLKNSLTKLTELAKGDARMGKFESTDLIAATALAKVAMEAIKLSQTGKAPRDDDKTPPDLFDGKADSPWKLDEVK